jgi:pyridoxamine 5'-phosphate oxidase
VDERGFVFYTHKNSPKSLDLQQHSHCALGFHWKSLRRQVRIEGYAHFVDQQELDSFFASRPRSAQIDIIASQQSQILGSKQEMIAAREYWQGELTGKKIAIPAHWIGYRVVPDRLEFWQSDTQGLHDRVLWERSGETWQQSLLYP